MSPGEATRWIRHLRPPREEGLDPWRPYGVEVEVERSRAGTLDPTGTVFITNRECPFTCLMCDLWKYTTESSVPVGAVDAQVAEALERLGGVRHLKLYNAGSFFDDRAISPEDRARIARRAREQAAGTGPEPALETLIVECHPRLVDGRAAAFRDAAGTELDVAMGLETVHEPVLERLNKRMTLDDFARATERLLEDGVQVRAFILVRPPYQNEEEGLEWACRSLEWAFARGVECCVLIPTRGGNGALEALAASGDFAPPRLTSLEAALEYGVSMGRGRVFADLWDVARVPACPVCREARVARLRRMNETQTAPERVVCEVCEG